MFGSVFWHNSGDWTGAVWVSCLLRQRFTTQLLQFTTQLNKLRLRRKAKFVIWSSLYIDAKPRESLNWSLQRGPRTPEGLSNQCSTTETHHRAGVLSPPGPQIPLTKLETRNRLMFTCFMTFWFCRQAQTYARGPFFRNHPQSPKSQK